MPITPDEDALAAQGEAALTGIDLHAWQPPPPPAGLADAVVARIKEPAVVQAAATRSARTIVAAIAGTFVVAAAIAVVVMTHGASEPREPVATAPALALAPPSAPLPAGGPVGGDGADAERVRVLEARVAELEARLAKLEEVTVRHGVDPFRPPPPRPVAPEPPPPPVVPVPGRNVDPFAPVPKLDPFAPVPKLDPFDPYGGPKGAPLCDAPALIRQGKASLDAGVPAAAESLFEQAMRCDPFDHSAVKLAYLAACRSSHVDTVHVLYAQLTAGEQAQLVQLCLVNGIDPRDAAPPPPAPAPTSTRVAGDGKVELTTKPVAKVYIDGRDTKETTPVTLELPAGKHKVTFEIGGDKYTYPLTIIAGQRMKISKDIQ